MLAQSSWCSAVVLDAVLFLPWQCPRSIKTGVQNVVSKIDSSEKIVLGNVVLTLLPQALNASPTQLLPNLQYSYYSYYSSAQEPTEKSFLCSRCDT